MDNNNTSASNHPFSNAEVKPKENEDYFPSYLETIPAYYYYLYHVKEISFVNCKFTF